MRLLDARLAFEEDHVALAKDKLKYCSTHYRGIMTKYDWGKEKQLIDSLANTLAMLGEQQLVIDILRTEYSITHPAYRKKMLTESIFEKEEKHHALKLAALINKDPEHFLDYVEYAVRSQEISAEGKANFLVDFQLVKNVPLYCVLPLSALSYHYSADANVSKLTKIRALENFCLLLNEDKLSSQAIRHNLRLNEEAKAGMPSYPKLGRQKASWALSNIVTIYLDRNDFKNAKKAFEAIPSMDILASAGNKAVILNACSLGGEDLVRKMIEEAKALPVLDLIIYGCRKTQQSALGISAIQKGRVLINARALFSQSEKDFYLAQYDLSEIINILETTKYSRKGIDKGQSLLKPLIKRVLALQISALKQFSTAASPEALQSSSALLLKLYRESAIAALDCGMLSEASDLNTRADLLEESLPQAALSKWRD